MKRIILTLIVILGVLCQPCYAVDKKPSISELKKPEGKYVEHKVCLYINEKGTVPTYKYFYPMLDGETRKIESDTQIELNAPVDELQAISVKLYNDSLVFYEREHIRKEKELTVPVINSNQFCGNATLELKLQYINGNLENYNFYFEKEDNYSDIVLEDEPHINASGESDIVISFAIENFSKLIYPEKISVMNSSGKNCASYKDKYTKNVYGRIIVPFEPDGLDRDYKVIIPAGCIMLDNGLNNELIFEVKNEIEYVTVSNFVDSASPMPDQIKYIDGDKDVIAVTIKINDEFKVDDTKLLLFNHKPVDYIAEVTYNGTILKFNADVMTGKRYNVEFGEGLIVGKNGEINGAKENYYFSVVNVNSINLPEKVIFIDLPINHWAYDYITQLALEDIISGYEDRTFRPDGYVTRGELAKLLSASFNTTGKTEFSDFKEHWAKQYILTVGEFIPTKNGLFRPDEKATRQDVAVSLVNIIEHEKIMDLIEQNITFNDIPMIDTEYISQIKKAVYAKIISGYEDGTFRPQEAITRAEVATMICRLIDIK